MNREDTLKALEKSEAVLTVRHRLWFLRLFDWVTGERYERFWTTIRVVPWGTLYIAHPILINVGAAWRVIAHELVHVAQWKRLGWFRMVAKYLTQTGRLELEAEAYALSVKVEHYTLDDAAVVLKESYFLPSFSLGDIKVAINEHLETLK